MGLFEKAGEKFEKTKQSVMEGKDADYVCESCNEPVKEDFDHCPHCGDAAVEPVE